MDGQRWIAENADRLSKMLEAGRAIPEPKQRPNARLLREVQRSELYASWQEHGTVVVEKWEAAELLRRSPDSSARVWRERIEVLRGAAFSAERKDILGFLDVIFEGNPQWFGEGARK